VDDGKEALVPGRATGELCADAVNHRPQCAKQLENQQRYQAAHQVVHLAQVAVAIVEAVPQLGAPRDEVVGMRRKHHPQLGLAGKT
jgi:hypothetical protein